MGCRVGNAQGAWGKNDTDVDYTLYTEDYEHPIDQTVRKRGIVGLDRPFERSGVW